MPASSNWPRRLGLSIEQAVRQQRWMLRYKHCKRVRQKWLDRSPPDSMERSRRCLIDLRRIASDGEHGRRFHALIRLLQRGGYAVSMVPRLRFLQSGHRYFKANALATISPFFEDRIPQGFEPFDLCLSDGPSDHRYARRTIRVLTGTRHGLADGDLAMPYSMYPDVWDRGEDQRLQEYRARQRTWRFFFGGHCSKESYTRIRKYKRIRPVNRYRVVNEVLSYFGDATLRIESDAQLASALESRHDSFVMIDNGTYRTEASRWLGLLATADFFLAAPGCDYPMSHNAIEAMAVGTIPVLEYDSLFTPPLIDGQSCIVYRGLNGLRSAMKRISQMTPGEIERLRQGVIGYYESHLGPESFCRDLEAAGTQRLHLFSYLTPSAKAA